LEVVECHQPAFWDTEDENPDVLVSCIERLHCFRRVFCYPTIVLSHLETAEAAHGGWLP
jgi:hypothetical protein